VGESICHSEVNGSRASGLVDDSTGWFCDAYRSDLRVAALFFCALCLGFFAWAVVYPSLKDAGMKAAVLIGSLAIAGSLAGVALTLLRSSDLPPTPTDEERRAARLKESQAKGRERLAERAAAKAAADAHVKALRDGLLERARKGSKAAQIQLGIEQGLDRRHSVDPAGRQEAAKTFFAAELMPPVDEPDAGCFPEGLLRDGGVVACERVLGSWAAGSLQGAALPSEWIAADAEPLLLIPHLTASEAVLACNSVMGERHELPTPAALVELPLPPAPESGCDVAPDPPGTTLWLKRCREQVYWAFELQPPPAEHAARLLAAVDARSRMRIDVPPSFRLKAVCVRPAP
jgi:hypothetical protein